MLKFAKDKKLKEWTMNQILEQEITDNFKHDCGDLYKTATKISGYARELNVFLILIAFVFLIVLSTSPRFHEGEGIIIGVTIMTSVLIFCWLNYALFIFGSKIAKVLIHINMKKQ